jgi:hypothetical protein
MTTQFAGALLGTAAAALYAWQAGGAVGAGALVGFLLGASLTGFGNLWQEHTARRTPALAMRTFVLCFAGKLAVLGLLVLAGLMVPAFAERVALVPLVLAFALAVGLIDVLRGVDGYFSLRARSSGPALTQDSGTTGIENRSC